MYLVRKLSGTLGRYVVNESIPLKIIFISVLKLQDLAPLQIPASLRKGPIYYFYARVSSIPSHSNLLFSWQASCGGERLSIYGHSNIFDHELLLLTIIYMISKLGGKTLSPIFLCVRWMLFVLKICFEW